MKIAINASRRLSPLRVITFLILCLMSAALADDFKTIDGKEYKNVKVSRVEPDGVVITFSGGIVKIAFTELSPEDQKKYGYDSKAAADFQQQAYEAGLQRAREISEAQQKTVDDRKKYWSEHATPVPSGQSVASSMQGTMLDQRPAGSSSVQGSAQDAPTGPKQLIYGTVLNVVNEGLLVSVQEMNLIGTERIPNGAPVLLIGNFPGIYDQDKVQATGRLIGSYGYTSIDGAKRTARALAGASVNKINDFPFQWGNPLINAGRSQ